MENKQPAKNEGSSICSDLDQLNLADFGLDEDFEATLNFAFDEFEAKSNDGNVEEIKKIKVELVELKKEIEAMKLASKSDSNEIVNKLDIDHLKKYMNDELQKLAQENQKKGKKEDKDVRLMEEIKKMELEEEIDGLKEEISQKDQKLAELEVKIFLLKYENAKLKQKKAVGQQSIIKNVWDGEPWLPPFNAKSRKVPTAAVEVNKMELKLNNAYSNIYGHCAGCEHRFLQMKAVDQQSTIEDFANLKMWDDGLLLPNAKSTKSLTVADDDVNVNKTELIVRKAYSKLTGYCAGCEQGFLMNDWARQVGDLQYHVRCFKCDHCRRQLFTDEEFVQDSKVLLKNRALDKMVPRILCKKDTSTHQMVNAVKLCDLVTNNYFLGRKWQID